MEEKDALCHMISWAMNQIYKTEQEALAILNDESLGDKKKMALLQAEHGPEIRLLNLIVLLKPALELAKKEFPEQEQFFEWFEGKWRYIVENNYLKGDCGCKGCKKDTQED